MPDTSTRVGIALAEPLPRDATAQMKFVATVVHVCLALSLAACGGGGHLSVETPGGGDMHETHTLVFAPGQPMEYTLPFRLSGGIPPYESTLLRGESRNCPDWVTLFPDQRILAGTAPAADVGRTFFCVYRVTESDPGFRPQRSVTHGLRIEVAGSVAQPLALPPPSKVELSVGTFHDKALPVATGGVQPYTYSFTCAGGALPSGMGFAPATRRFAGTPDARFRDSCTYSATDSSQPAAMVSAAVEVEVTGAAGQILALPPPSKVELSVGTFHDKALPVATGGVQPYTYSFTCAGGALPSGMGFAPATRRFAGTPDARFRDSCTYSATDSSQPAAMVSAAVEVEVTGAAAQPLALPAEVVPGNRLSFQMERRYEIEFASASEDSGVGPYTYDLQCDLPRGLGFSPNTRILSGTPLEIYRGPNCTYRVADSSSPPVSVARSVSLIVGSLDPGTWRFRTRSVPQSDHPLDREESDPQRFVTLPHAIGGMPDGDLTYSLPDALAPLEFDEMTRVLSYRQGSTDPLFDTPITFRYLVGTETDLNPENADDALCVDISYRDPPPRSESPSDGLLNSVRISVRDDAFRDDMEWRCPDAGPQSSASSRSTQSNPVHEALGPVHARRALDVAHGVVRDRVRGWTPGAPRVLIAIAPQAGIGSLTGESDGFDYTGSSEAVSTGAEIGSGSWQAGLVGSYTRTELRYRAGAGLAERGYRSGEHTTEILSLHPFAAWHVPSGGNVWASLGAGTGWLRHRDDLGFPSWSRSDVQLRAYAVGASVPVADVLSGELEAEAGIESFAFEIEGGDWISSELPTMHGRDYRAGLAWSAPIAGAPSLSVAYKHLTGDGPEGGQLEAKGSVSVEGIFDPRLTVIGNAEGSFGLGDYEHDSWSLGGGVRFAPGEEGARGLALNLDTRLASLGDGEASNVGLRGEAGYGLWGGPYFGTVRPYVGLIRYSSDGSLRRTLGIDLRNTPASRANVEFHDRSGDRFRSLRFTLRHRF